MERSNIFVLSIVAVVAVVGLLTMFLQGGTGGAPATDVFVDEQGNVVGEAIRYRQLAYNPYAAKPESQRVETLAGLNASRMETRDSPEDYRRATSPDGYQRVESEASRTETRVSPEDYRRRESACLACTPVYVRLYGSGTRRLAGAAGPGVTDIITFNNDGWDNSLALHSMWLAESRIPEQPGRPVESVTLMIRPDREESSIWPLTLRVGESRDVVFGSGANRFTVNTGLVEIVGKHNYVVLALTRR